MQVNINVFGVQADVIEFLNYQGISEQHVLFQDSALIITGALYVHADADVGI